MPRWSLLVPSASSLPSRPFVGTLRLEEEGCGESSRFKLTKEYGRNPGGQAEALRDSVLANKGSVSPRKGEGAGETTKKADSKK